MGRSEVEQVWGSADYALTASRLRPVASPLAERLTRELGGPARVVDLGAGHGDLAAALAAGGHDVIALEPVERMREVGAGRSAPGIRWIDGLGEATGLADASVDGIGSNFGAFLCDPRTGPAEWVRILAPGGVLVMTAWDGHGFLAEMTRRMMAVMYPDGGGPPHMAWGDDDFARSVLAPHFAEVSIEHGELAWRFASVDEGMRLYREGSPTHTFSFAMAGEKRATLEAALEDHLQESADAHGRIDSVAGYSLIVARRAR